MPITWSDLPPDHPIFSDGVRFVVGPEEPQEFTIYAGELVPTSELAASLRVTPAEDDEVEFVSPSVPGRTVSMNRSVPLAEESD